MNKDKIYFAVKGFLLHENKFLIMHDNGHNRQEQNLWELPGGRMEFGETAEETLIREMKEETGLTVKPIKVLDTWNSVRGDHQITGIIYYCQAEEYEVKLSSEHDDYKWVAADASSIENMFPWFKERMINWNWEKVKSLKGSE